MIAAHLILEFVFESVVPSPTSEGPKIIGLFPGADKRVAKNVSSGALWRFRSSSFEGVFHLDPEDVRSIAVKIPSNKPLRNVTMRRSTRGYQGVQEFMPSL